MKKSQPYLRLELTRSRLKLLIFSLPLSFSTLGARRNEIDSNKVKTSWEHPRQLKVGISFPTRLFIRKNPFCISGEFPLFGAR